MGELEEREKILFKVAIVNEYGKNEVVELPIIPRVGDTLPVFYKPYPKVNNVMLMPEKAFPADFKGKNLDAIVTV